MLVEKRKAHRIDVHIRAQYSSNGATIDGWVDNLSRHGAFLRSDFLDEPGSDGTVELSIPGQSGPLCITGEVVRVDSRPNHSGMGISFGAIPDEARRELARYVMQHSYDRFR